jgi:NADPH:quinone reductase-like Zn-dependent oxidoreductase
MRAVRFHEYGGPEVLRCEQVADPEPGPADVVIRVRAVGLNHVDIDMRNGTSNLPLELPHTLGFEFGGEIVAVGEEVDSLATGDRVTALYQVACRACDACLAGRQQFCERLEMLGVTRPGGYAELVAVPAAAVLPLPDGMSFDQAASTQTTFGTAWHSLITRGGLQLGETALVSAAGSGVGSAGLQVARHAGARVIVSAGSDEKLDRARALGADVGINYREEDLTARVLEETHGRGVDIVLEHVGGEVFSSSLDALAVGGRVVVCGGHAGEVVPLDLIKLFRKESSVIGCARATEAEIGRVIELVAAGVFEPAISEHFSLEDAADAHRAMEDRRQFGKLIMHP